MSRTIAALLAAVVLPASMARAQDPHAGHHMPAAPKPADPHAGRAMPAQPATDDGYVYVPPPPPPPVPADYDADRFYPKAAMDGARAHMAHEHGGMSWSKVVAEKFELRPAGGGYAWEGRAGFGGDIDRVLVKSRGEGDRRLERGEVQGLWSHAISPWFNLEAGARQDLQHGGRTYAALGVDGLAPYEFDIDAALFLSTRGDLSARLEASHAYRLTRRLVLEPRAEAELAATSVPGVQVGAGLSRVELGLRLRYMLTPEFAPYAGVEHERAVGRTARLRRTAGEDPRDTRLVLGVRAWF